MENRWSTFREKAGDAFEASKELGLALGDYTLNRLEFGIGVVAAFVGLGVAFGEGKLLNLPPNPVVVGLASLALMASGAAAMYDATRRLEE